MSRLSVSAKDKLLCRICWRNRLLVRCGDIRFEHHSSVQVGWRQLCPAGMVLPDVFPCLPDRTAGLEASSKPTMANSMFSTSFWPVQNQCRAIHAAVVRTGPALMHCSHHGIHPPQLIDRQLGRVTSPEPFDPANRPGRAISKVAIRKGCKHCLLPGY